MAPDFFLSDFSEFLLFVFLELFIHEVINVVLQYPVEKKAFHIIMENMGMYWES